MQFGPLIDLNSEDLSRKMPTMLDVKEPNNPDGQTNKMTTMTAKVSCRPSASSRRTCTAAL